jgi:hypothetical protein
MSFLRTLAVFVLSFIFTSTVFIAVSYASMGNLLRKESVKEFLNVEGAKFIEEQCQKDCNQSSSPTCLQNCSSTSANQTTTLVDKAVDELYQKQFYGLTLNEVSSFSYSFLLYFVLILLSGGLLFIASKNPFSTLGKNLVMTSLSLFVTSFSTQFVITFVNLPLDLSKAVNDFLSSSFDKQINIAIILLSIGIIFIMIDYFIRKRKKKTILS